MTVPRVFLEAVSNVVCDEVRQSLGHKQAARGSGPVREADMKGSTMHRVTHCFDTPDDGRWYYSTLEDATQQVKK